MKKKGSSEQHSKLINKILLDKQDENCRVWKNQVGLACDYDSTKRMIYYLCEKSKADELFYKIRKIKFGLKGSPDIIGIKKIKITPDMVGKEIGIFCGYEAKTGNSKQTKEQKMFEKMINRMKGIYAVIREN